MENIDADLLGGLAPYRDARLSSDVEETRTQNMVAKAMFSTKIDLHHITNQMPNTVYRPSNFAALIWRNKESNATFLLFSAGAMVCVGTQSKEAARLACQKCRLQLRANGYDVKMTKFEIVNEVQSGWVKHRVNVAQLNADNMSCSTYEPAEFPGCSYVIEDLGVNVLIFDSGQFIMMGFRDKKVARKALTRVKALLARYRSDEGEVASKKRYRHRIDEKARVVAERKRVDAEDKSGTPVLRLNNATQSLTATLENAFEEEREESEPVEKRTKTQKEMVYVHAYTT